MVKESQPQEAEVVLTDAQKIEALQKEVRNLKTVAVQLDTLMQATLPGIEAASLVALHTLMQSSIEVKVPKEWTSKEYLPIQKIVTEMNERLDEAAQKKFEKVEQLNGKKNIQA